MSQKPHNIKQEPSKSLNPHSRPSPSPSTVTRVSRTNGIVLIPQLEVVDQELAYQQRLHRPFKVVQNLPVSDKSPDYEKLTHPLSIKDSGVLYNSLLVSRHNWLYNVFPTCWSRRDQYMNESGDRKRDRMSKICSMKIQCGPHTFEAKLFILKDEAKEAKHQQEVEQRREEREKRKQRRLEEKKERAKLRKQGVLNGPGRPPMHININPLSSLGKLKTLEGIQNSSKKSEEAKKSGKPHDEVPKSTNDIMSNPQNVIMIHNLNQMAKKNSHLSTLMQTVASGHASKDQITEFQGFIKKARGMGDVDGYLKKKADDKGDSKQTKKDSKKEGGTKADKKANKKLEAMRIEEKKIKRQQRKEERMREKLRREKERMERRHRKEMERQARLHRKEEREKEKKMLRELAMQRQKTPGSEEDLVRREMIEGKLTSFQQRYSSGATLVFEFSENTSARFFLPRDAIMEVIGGDDKVKKEEPAKLGSIRNEPGVYIGEDDKPYVDILASFVLVHNQVEIDQWKERKRARDERKKAEKNEASKDVKTVKNTKKRRRRRRNWGPSKRSSSKERHERELRKEVALSFDAEDEQQQAEVDPEPVPVYSAVTVTMKQVPAKFGQLVKNSGDSLEDSRSYIQHIMDVGQRLQKQHLWYRLDGVRDELLAETLRFNLNRMDYVNGGGRLKGRAMLRKIVEKTGSEAEVKFRRRRRK